MFIYRTSQFSASQQKKSENEPGILKFLLFLHRPWQNHTAPYPEILALTIKELLLV